MTAVSVTLLDKHALASWAAREHRLTGAEARVLDVVLFRLLGAGGARPFNGWSTLPTIAAAAGVSERTAGRALARLHTLELVKRSGLRGNTGRTLLHCPDLPGAAERRKPPPLGRTRAALQTGQSCPVSAVSNRTKRASQTGQSCPESPSTSPQTGNYPREGATGDAGSRAGAPAARPVQDSEWGGEVPLNHGRARLLDRFNGCVRKVAPGLFVTSMIFEMAGPKRTARWLRLQHEGKDGALLRDAFELVALCAGPLDHQELGRAMGAVPRPEPEPPPEPEPAAAASVEPVELHRPADPPPAKRPARPVRALATALRSGAAAPPASPPARPPLELDPAELRASASRLAALDPPAPRPGRRAGFHNHRDPFELAASVARLNASVAPRPTLGINRAAYG